MYLYFPDTPRINQTPSTLKQLTRDNVWVFHCARIFFAHTLPNILSTSVVLAFVNNSHMHCRDVTQHNKFYLQACTVQQMFTTPNVFKHKQQIATRPLDARTPTNPSKTKINLNFI